MKILRIIPFLCSVLLLITAIFVLVRFDVFALDFEPDSKSIGYSQNSKLLNDNNVQFDQATPCCPTETPTATNTSQPVDPTPSNTWVVFPSATPTPTITPTPTNTPTVTVTFTVTQTSTQTSTGQSTNTPTVSATASSTLIVTNTATHPAPSITPTEPRTKPGGEGNLQIVIFGLSSLIVILLLLSAGITFVFGFRNSRSR